MAEASRHQLDGARAVVVELDDRLLIDGQLAGDLGHDLLDALDTDGERLADQLLVVTDDIADHVAALGARVGRVVQHVGAELVLVVVGVALGGLAVMVDREQVPTTCSNVAVDGGHVETYTVTCQDRQVGGADTTGRSGVGGTCGGH